MSIVNKLDSRIKNVSDIQSEMCYDNSFVGEVGYFADTLSEFWDLNNCIKGTLRVIDEEDDNLIFGCKNGDDRDWYEFFIPEKLLKSVEKKYKPYTVLQLSHDIVTRKLSGFITFRRKADRSHDIYILRYNGTFTENRVDYVCLGAKTYSMKELFEEYELKKDNKWQPFGIEIEE